MRLSIDSIKYRYFSSPTSPANILVSSNKEEEGKAEDKVEDKVEDRAEDRAENKAKNKIKRAKVETSNYISIEVSKDKVVVHSRVYSKIFF